MGAVSAQCMTLSGCCNNKSLGIYGRYYANRWEKDSDPLISILAAAVTAAAPFEENAMKNVCDRADLQHMVAGGGWEISLLLSNPISECIYCTRINVSVVDLIGRTILSATDLLHCCCPAMSCLSHTRALSALSSITRRRLIGSSLAPATTTRLNDEN